MAANDDRPPQPGPARPGPGDGSADRKPGRDASLTSPTPNTPKGAPPDGTTTDDDDAPSVAALPSPTLPKGGGAVRGLGETFQVNPSNGTFSVTIPIQASPARGLEPDLTLRYDSGAGNGLYGEGWSLGLGAVSRKTDKTLPRYRDADVFLAGGEDLVPAVVPDGGVWAQGRRDDSGHVVQCFRPRVEAGYDRIERWTRTADRDVHWRIRRAGGRVDVYGEAPEARVADPADPTRVLRWLVERSYDARGNLIRYRYRAEDRAGVAATIWEQHRAVAYTLPDRIWYGARAPYDPAAPAPDDPAAFLFEVVFDYGERAASPDAAPPPYAAPGTWTARADAFSSFKGGFDLRCYRLCQRVLMFHRTGEPGAAPALVREMRLRYDGDPSLCKLIGATAIGWRGDASLRYPEATFAYTEAVVDPAVRRIDIASAENLPAPVDGKRTQWVDLDGEGIPGALIDDRPGWFYKRNLGGGALAPVESLATRPSLDLAGGGQLTDVAGDGTKALVRFGGPAPGAFARTAAFDWAPFTAFAALPTVAMDDPNLRFVDLDGDGRADLLITEDRVLRWYPSLGYDGFGSAELVPKALDEDRGPALVFGDAEQAIYTADMTGDGLSDLVRVRNGEVAYWPNLGYGRFGAKVTMSGAPRFASAAAFARADVRLSDVDGSGTTDLLYCDAGRVRYWRNLAGNRFDAAREIAGLPYDSSARIEVVDLLGDGTSCLVWSSPLAWHARQPLRYVSLTGGVKPHMLCALDNHLGRAAQIAYAPSTRYYLQDRAAGRPWATRVPFPVQVVARLTTIDQVTGHQLSADYAYHHGFYDGFEREFRGFGMVEQTDTQTLASLASQGLFPAGVDYVPPARTCTWFHTGAFLEGEALIERFRAEWFAGDLDQARLDPGVMPEGLDPIEWREALRALRGRPLRVETYADEVPATPVTAIPYRTVEHNYRVRVLQPRGDNAHGVFVADTLETLAYHYERDAADPRIEHEVVLRIGTYGAVEQRARIGYPRRGSGADPLVALAEHDVMARDQEPALYRVNVAAETRLYEITGLAVPPATPFVLVRASVQPIAALAGTANDLGFEQAISPGILQRRVVRRTQLRYLGDDDATPLGVGAFGARALLYQSERAVLPIAMVPAILPPAIDAGALAAAGYVQHDGLWWAPSSTIGYAAAAFYLPTQIIDPFGNPAHVVYDALALQPHLVTNALGQSTSVDYDPLALQPIGITDVNGNATLAAYDALGRLTDIAKTGKAGEGDSLAAPTTHYDYVLTAWRDLATPNHTHTRQRLVHGADGFQEQFDYADGFGRALQSKRKADPGAAQVVQTGAVTTVTTSDRWVATGRTVYDNKGNAVRTYEPFYAVGSAYEPDLQLGFLGVASVTHHDPLGRAVRVDQPDGSFTTVAIGAWEVRESDADDTCADEAQLWATRPGQTAADQRAVKAARLHRRTPTRHRGDALGRRISTFADNTPQDAVADTPDAAHVLYETRRVLDVQGQPIAVYDERGLRAAPPFAVVTRALDMTGRALRVTGCDTGTSSTLQDCLSKSFYTRDARGFELRWRYDVLRRPVGLDVTDTARAASWQGERTIYGDDPVGAPPDPSANLLGRVYQVFDQAGVATSARYDFKGNLLEQTRQLIAGYTGAPDWTRPYLAPFGRGTVYDALDRVVTTTLPRRNLAAGVDNVETRAYLVHGPVSRITVRTQYAAAPIDVISDVEYDAKGRRISLRQANGVVRGYTYDPLSSRLATVTASRNAGAETLQQLAYTYDAAGNVTELSDAAQPTVFNRNQQIDPRLAFTYDSSYRLTDATGRELHDAGQPADGELAFGGWPPDANDLVNYAEHYDYDAAGNLVQVRHTANNSATHWTRGYGYDPQSNRLTGTSLPAAAVPTVLGASYGYDRSGNITAMPHLAAVEFDEQGRLVSADQLGGGVVYARFDGSGQRVRKVQTRRATSGEVVSYERIYLGDYEIYRELDASGAATLELESVHGIDGTSRAVLIETETTTAAPAPVYRYQLDNHLGSSVLELDDHAAVLSYEEYHPFGTTAFRAGTGVAEVSLKRYRFLGKERDTETGFYYCGSRHYCPWLGRWISADPTGIGGGLNLYVCSNNSPIRFSDASGNDPNDSLSSTLLYTGIGNPLFTPNQPVGAQTLELVGSQGVNLGYTGSGGSTSLLGSYRLRVSERLEVGVLGSYGGQYPWHGGDASNSNFTGSQLALTSHFGERATDALSQGSSGLYLTGGFLFGQGPDGATNATNPFVSATTGYSHAWRSPDPDTGEINTDHQVDINAIVTASRFNNSINGRVATGALSALLDINYSAPFGLNVEAAVGPVVGTDRIPFAPNTPGSPLTTPFTLRTQLGVGYSFPFAGNYAFGIEAIVTKDWLPSVVDAGGNSAGPLGLTINIGISSVNHPQHPQDDIDELHRFTRERDESGSR